MVTMKRLGFVLVVVVTLFVWILVGEAKEAPLFELQGLDGEMYSLENFRGRPVVLVFFHVNCPYCVQVLALMEELYQEYREKAFLSVLAIDMGDTKGKVERLMQKIGVTFPVLLDTDVTVSAAYNVMHVPTVFFVDPQGNLVDGFIGAQRETVVRNKLDRILWFRGLKAAEIRNLISLTGKVVVLDTRRDATNPFSQDEHVEYKIIQDLTKELPRLNPQDVYVLLVTTNQEGVEWGLKMAQAGFTRVYYQMVDASL
ncbi:MAG: TlpA family protein disulfide reductase [Atribacterota bacterium]|nr:TlpA family protein disulfide reductase [Atribacterota bacterium]